MSDLVEIGAKGAYAENDWWRSVAHDDDGKGRYQEMNGVRMRAVEWRELDADDRDSRLKEARAALTAIEKAGHRIVPKQPTDEMLWAALSAGHFDGIKDDADMRLSYAAMLAAAPKVVSHD